MESWSGSATRRARGRGARRRRVVHGCTRASRGGERRWLASQSHPRRLASQGAGRGVVHGRCTRRGEPGAAVCPRVEQSSARRPEGRPPERQSPVWRCATTGRGAASSRGQSTASGSPTLHPLLQSPDSARCSCRSSSSRRSMAPGEHSLLPTPSCSYFFFHSF